MPLVTPAWSDCSHEVSRQQLGMQIEGVLHDVYKAAGINNLAAQALQLKTCAVLLPLAGAPCCKLRGVLHDV